VLGEVTPHVEPVSIDEAFLDVTPTPHTTADPVEVARSIQGAVDALGLSCSIGVATSKTVAKIASDRDKPHGITVVRPGEEAAFLAPMPVTALPGIGAATAERLRVAGIHTLGELGSLDPVSARSLLGSASAEFTDRARGIDDRPVRAARSVKSVSNERTFAADVHDAGEVDAALRELVSRVAVRLRATGLAGRTLTVKIRYGDFTTRTVRQTLEHPTDMEATLLPAARVLLARAWTPGTGLRLMGFGVSGFSTHSDQLDLLAAGEIEHDERRRALSRSLDAVRQRFGDDIIGFGPHAAGTREGAAIDDDGDD
jgi:DNA polymerase-4